MYHSINKFFCSYSKIPSLLRVSLLTSLSLVCLLAFIGSVNLTKPARAAEVQVKSLNGSVFIPSENIKPAPIIGYKFIYIQTEASVLDFLNKQSEALKTQLMALGIVQTNVAIVFTDFYGYSNFHTSQQTNPTHFTYTNQDGTKLDLTPLLTKYCLEYLTQPRTVLVGTIVSDGATGFQGNETLKVQTFNFPNATGFEYFSHAFLKQKKVSPSSLNISNIGDYTYLELIQQRLSMIQYMNLDNFKHTNFMGMLELKDLQHGLYEYFALPITKLTVNTKKDANV